MNLRPLGYEPNELTELLHPANCIYTWISIWMQYLFEPNCNLLSFHIRHPNCIVFCLRYHEWSSSCALEIFQGHLLDHFCLYSKLSDIRQVLARAHPRQPNPHPRMSLCQPNRHRHNRHFRLRVLQGLFLPRFSISRRSPVSSSQNCLGE